MTPGQLTLALLVPAAALVAFWLWLAVRRARQTDPIRPRREARQRMAATLSQLPSANPEEKSGLLLGWQHDAGILWQLPNAAPRASELPDATWATLWTEADRALYGRLGTLPSDWAARAHEALAAKRLPRFQVRRLFLPQNLWPFAAVIALGVVSTVAVLRAAETSGLTAYQKGDFAGAEKAFRSAVERTPTDWIARHNLSLVLAQLDRPGESAAHAAAAFVQKPDQPSVRWHFALSAEKAGVVPPSLSHFITPDPWRSLGRLARHHTGSLC
jgi:hypothetical protein